MHLHGQVVVLGADVLGQQVDGLGPSVPDADLGPAREQRAESEPGARPPSGTGSQERSPAACGRQSGKALRHCGSPSHTDGRLWSQGEEIAPGCKAS